MTHKNAKILKFGGSCLASPEALKRASSLIRQELPKGGVVVVSALQGATDLLLAALATAQAGDEVRVQEQWHAIQRRHLEMARSLGLEATLATEWSPLLDRLKALLGGVCRVWEVSPRTRDAVLALGEGLATHLLRALLEADGCRATFVDARELILTDGRHGRARPRLEAIQNAVQALRPKLEEGQVIVTQGFVGSAPDGVWTTLGRGGSDTTATLLGEALQVSEVLIWTETDGILTADPSLVPEAQPIPHMSLSEIAALSAFGAKVLHADALAPVARVGFSLVVANALSPQHRTEIHKEWPGAASRAITSVAYKEGLACIHFGAEPDLEVLLQVASLLQEAGAVRYGMVDSPEGALLVVRAEMPEATVILRRLKAEGFRVETGWAVVALVGEGLRTRPGYALTLLATLDGERIGGLLAGGDGISAAVLVRENRLAELIPRLHGVCF